MLPPLALAMSSASLFWGGRVSIKCNWHIMYGFHLAWIFHLFYCSILMFHFFSIYSISIVSKLFYRIPCIQVIWIFLFLPFTLTFSPLPIIFFFSVKMNTEHTQSSWPHHCFNVDSFFNQTFSFYWFKKDIQICVHVLTRLLIQFTHALRWGIEAKSKTQNCMHYNISHLIRNHIHFRLRKNVCCVYEQQPNHSIFFCVTHFCSTFYDSIKIERWKLRKNFDSIWIMYIFSSKDSEHLCMRVYACAARYIFPFNLCIIQFIFK